MKEEKKEKDDLKAEVRVSVRKGSLAPEYLSILKEAGGASGNYTIVVTSTARTPYDQARVMFENLERTGVPYQRRQYRQPGREVIAVYEELSDKKKDKGEILFAMEQKIKYLGPENVSKHCSDKGNVADVAKSIRRSFCGLCGRRWPRCSTKTAVFTWCSSDTGKDRFTGRKIVGK